MSIGQAISDTALCASLLGLAFAALFTRDLFKAVALFILFGSLMALGWARLAAPDLALTEAALGAGLLGALFLVTLGRLKLPFQTPVKGGRRRFAAVTMVASVVLLVTVWRLFFPAGGDKALPNPPDLTQPALAALDRSGVTNPVTAVILNYRAYDTFLELGVLLVVALSVLALLPKRSDTATAPFPSDALSLAYARSLAPFMTLAGAYLLWTGAHQPGGAFQAGCILGGVGVLALVVGFLPGVNISHALRASLAAGFVVFGAAGIFALLSGRDLMEWNPGTAKHTILAIETAATVSIGLILATLFAACAGRVRLPRAADETNRGAQP